MTTSITDATQEHCQSLADYADAVSSKFGKLFSLFAVCHNMYSTAAVMDDLTIIKLGKCENIYKFTH